MIRVQNPRVCSSQCGNIPVRPAIRSLCGSVCDFRSAAIEGRVRPMRGKVKQMAKQAAIVLLVLGMIGEASARERDFLARFDGGIGVIPVSNGAGPSNPDGTVPNVKLNVVRGVFPGAGPWRIADLRANVDTDGRLSVRGRGLLLASSNSIGQHANQRVFATLICE